MEVGALLRYDESPLLRDAMRGAHFSVWEYFNDGAYPRHQPEKAEVERLVEELIAGWDGDDLHAAVERNKQLLVDWAGRRVASAASAFEWARLAAFAELQRLVDESRSALDLDSYGLRSKRQPLAEALPEVHRAFSRDGLFRLCPDHVTDVGGSDMVFRVGNTAVYPDPRLRTMRELVSLLAELASSEPQLVVWVALDSYRFKPLEDVNYTILEDYWSGIQLTQANLDSLDAHDISTTSFHVAGNRTEAQKFFNPLVATSIDWAARDDDRSDPVKRLYIREFLPPPSGLGQSLLAVSNRELHAERDTTRRVFTHVDGKMRRYPTETYNVDRDNPRGPTGPHSHTRKLWRVDGDMTDEQWSELVGLYFRGNELVSEHFRRVFPGMP